MDEVERYIQDLKSEDFKVRCDAARALMKIGKPAISALVEALVDKDLDMRVGAAWAWRAALALGGIEDASAVPALVKALGDEDGSVRSNVAWALGKSVDRCETIEALESFEESLKEDFTALKKECRDKDKLIRAKMEVAKIMKTVSEKKNELASKRDILLSDKPKPPKRGKMYQAARRVRNG